MPGSIGFIQQVGWSIEVSRLRTFRPTLCSHVVHMQTTGGQKRHTRVLASVVFSVFVSTFCCAMAKPSQKSEKKVQEKYIDSLDKVSRERYEQKLTLVKNVDPYELTGWSDDPGILPPVEKDDINEYLVHRTSYYTRQQFKAEKSLGAHNQMTSGWAGEENICKQAKWM